MASLHELTEPIDQDTLKKLQENPQKPLESLQRNILRGHGRDRSVHIFLRFKTGQETAVKKWIKKLAEHIISAQRQLDETEQYRRYRIPGRLFVSFFLSAKGYEYLYPEQKGKLRNYIERERQKRDGTNGGNPGAGPDLVLVPDPYGKEYSGSYLVFRKLEQRVRDFKEYEQQLAKALGLTREDAKRAGALVMGRFEDGTPVVLQPTAGWPTNDFTYDEDPDGGKCPFQAHIHKVNPRKEGIPHIVRRGITYGERKKEPKDNPSLEELPSEDVGLLFMCYQKSIRDPLKLNRPRFYGILQLITYWRAPYGVDRFSHNPLH